jgi:hypothetical protein
LPRLHDAVRGFAIPDVRGRLSIIDVPRNYEVPVVAHLRCGATIEDVRKTLVLSKNGLLRLVEAL